MLMKLTIGVNFTSILLASLAPISFLKKYKANSNIR